jgi:hypothetical protein
MTKSTLVLVCNETPTESEIEDQLNIHPSRAHGRAELIGYRQARPALLLDPRVVHPLWRVEGPKKLGVHNPVRW